MVAMNSYSIYVIYHLYSVIRSADWAETKILCSVFARLAQLRWCITKITSSIMKIMKPYTVSAFKEAAESWW